MQHTGGQSSIFSGITFIVDLLVYPKLSLYEVIVIPEGAWRYQLVVFLNGTSVKR